MRNHRISGYSFESAARADQLAAEAARKAREALAR
jgi:hypothetical protein